MFISWMQEFIVVLVLLQLGQSYGLKCYVCNSAYDVGCNLSPPPDKYLVECNSNTAKPVFQRVSGDPRNSSIPLDRETIDQETQPLNFTTCRKDDATIPDQYYPEGWRDREGTRRIFRSCGWLGKVHNRCKLISHEPVFLIECTCTENNCNSGQQLQYPTILVLSILAVLISARTW